MGRRRGGDGETLSLFPFLSIMACLMGILVLLISGAAINRLAARPDTSAIERSRELAELTARSTTQEAELAKIRERAADAASLNEKLGEVRARLKLASEKKSEESKSRSVSSELQVQLALLRERLAKLQSELKNANADESELQAKAKTKASSSEAVVTIRQVGSGRNLRPTFVECTDAGVVVHDSDTPTRIRLADLHNSATFSVLLDRVNRQNNGTLIFLLRDNGQNAYWAAHGLANARGTRNGKIPVIGHGKLDLSQVKRSDRSSD